MPNSSITIDGITLDIDPADYTINDGVRRGSIHKLVGPGTVYQDRGFDVTDLRISMKGRLTTLATVSALMASYAKIGHTFHFTDFKGNDLICLYAPGEKSLTLKPIVGSNRGWEYEILLCVVSATAWLSSSFPPNA